MINNKTIELPKIGIFEIKLKIFPNNCLEILDLSKIFNTEFKIKDPIPIHTSK